MNGETTVDGYQDIHHNMRFWMTTLVDCAVRELVHAGVAQGQGASQGPSAPPSPNGSHVPGSSRPLVIYDIGANDGELTVPVAGRQLATGPSSPAVRVVAFEPQPAARARLMARTAQRGLTAALWGEADVTVVPLALGDRDELIALEVYSDDTFSSLHSRPPEELERYHLQVVETVDIRMRPLDDLVAAEIVPPPDIVKIDVEGAERAVLAGARKTLSRYHPPMLVEFSCPNCANAGYGRSAIVDELKAAGYNRLAGLFRNEDPALYTEDAFDDCRIWNVLAVHATYSPEVGAVMDRYHTPWKGSP
ncbi:MAG TPA: FkbM family methyltransferase [Alkalispirochaeta sp.]|nr:FkbM family methyltransferase [Alkalispirochaeta sp.]